MTRQTAYKRPSVAEGQLMPLDSSIVLDPTTGELTEPYCVLMQDDDGNIQAMVNSLGNGVTMTRTYWPGHADHRWKPTRVARTPQEVRYMVAERPAHMVAVPESIVIQMYRGWNLAFTNPQPQ